MNNKIIGLLGYKGSGKDTVAKILTEHGFHPLSFAENVKKVLAIIFDWELEMLEGHTYESRVWRDEVDQWWSERLDIPDFTPRKAMTMVGTDVFRKHFDDRIWILSLMKKIDRLNCPIVITDIRFKNEYSYVRELTDTIFRVHREDFEFEEIGIKASRGDQEAINFLRQMGIHDSEWDWLSCPVEDIINNSSDFVHLSQEIDEKIIQKL